MRTNRKMLVAVLVLLSSSQAFAYKVYTTDNSFSTADPGTTVNITNVTEFAMKAESHMQKQPVVNINSVSYAKSNTWMIIPDVGTPQGEVIPVKFVIDHVSNFPLNNGCTSIYDAATGAQVLLTCGVQHTEKEVLLKVGTKYRTATNAGTKFKSISEISSYVSKIVWSLPAESGRYTLVAPTVVPVVATTCSTDDGNNGHGNDEGKVDASNPGNSKK